MISDFIDKEEELLTIRAPIKQENRYIFSSNNMNLNFCLKWLLSSAES